MPDGGSDLAGRQKAGRYLVQEWLEQVVVAPVYHCKVHALAGQVTGGGEAPETTANDDDAVTASFRCASSVVAHSSRSVKCSPTLIAFAIAVRAGFTAPMLGKKLVSTT